MTRTWTARRLMDLGLIVAIASPFAQPAGADPNDLHSGVFIAHHCPECFSYSYDPPAGRWCAAYEPYAIHSLAEVIAQIPITYEVKLWYVLAAWETEDKTWCGTEFGLGEYDPAVYVITEAGVCAPGGYLEIPTAGWPGPNEGTAFVTTGTPWSGNWVPVYWFSGYGYTYAGASTSVPISVDPPTDFCGFSNCMNPPQLYSVPPDLRGMMGVNTTGYVPEWPADPRAACCLPDPPGACEVMFAWECDEAGGVWMYPTHLTCDPNPCPQTGACCVGGLCEILTEENCALIQGVFQGQGTTCEPNPCEAVCCYELGDHLCEIMLQADCLAHQGYWHPEWTTCDPDPCIIYSPPQESSWGRIKSIYR